MSYNYLPLDRKPISFQQLKNLLAFNQQVSITFSAHEQVLNCRAYLDKKMATENALFYGINTGFGYLQNVPIDKDQLADLQKNLLMSHACGMGDEVPEPIVKLMMALKIKSLCYGHSGVQIDTINRLMDMYNQQMFPVVYTQGSLGASGDLAPLSHLHLPLLGMGEVNFQQKRMSAAEALHLLNWQPISLQSKEGLALINGTQFMCAYGIYNLIQVRRLFNWALTIAALSFDAFDCVPDPLQEAIHKIRNQNGQIKVAQKLRNILQGSEILKQKKQQVQDPYSFRCIPQVLGASLDAIDYVQSIFLNEVNAVTDNPNIFPEEDMIISGGNFHGQPLALSLDFLCLAVAEIGNISERRTYQLISGQRNLPAFLIKNPGLHSGFMIPQYTAAGIVSENKQLCTPASIDSIPSSNNQEDHVSMGANAATKCYKVIQNVEKILAIELFTAAQAINFKAPLKTAPGLEKLVAAYRKKVSFNDADRVLHTDMINTVAFMQAEPSDYLK